MRSRTRTRAAALPILLLANAAAQAPPSGPAIGSPLPELRVSLAAGPGPVTERELLAELRRGPVAILFVHELTRNVAPMLRGFDRTSADLAVLGLQSAMVLLAGDRTAAEQRAPVVSKALQLHSPLMVSVDGAEGPGGYALNRKAELTLVLARDGLVLDAQGFVATGRQDLDLLEMALCSVTGPPPDDAELETVLARTLPADRGQLVRLVASLERQRRHAATLLEEGRGPAMTDARPAAMRGEARRAEPTPAATDAPAAVGTDTNPLLRLADAEVAAILRRIVRQDADVGALDAAFRELEARVGPDATLRAETAQAISAVLAAPHYGNALARQRLRDWLEQVRRRP